MAPFIETTAGQELTVANHVLPAIGAADTIRHSCFSSATGGVSDLLHDLAAQNYWD